MSIWQVLLAVWIALAVGGQVYRHVEEGHFTSEDAWGWGWFALLVLFAGESGAFDTIL